MEYRSLGRTGVDTSAIGLGMWAMGGDAYGPVDDANSLAALRAAYDVGINFYDTADIYGHGHSEEILGTWLKTIPRDQVLIATKGGLWSDSHNNYGRLITKARKAARRIGHRIGYGTPKNYLHPRHIIEHCEASLRRLGTNYIDLYQDHLWWDENLETFIEATYQLRKAGKIRWIGLSANDLAYIQRFHSLADGMDTLQLDYSLLHRAPEAAVLPFCQQHGIGVIVRGPLAMGKLTGKFTPTTTFAPNDGRSEWNTGPQRAGFLKDIERVSKLAPLATGRSFAQAALAFVLQHPAVSTAIPGAKYPEQVYENVGAVDRPLTPAERALVEQIEQQ